MTKLSDQVEAATGADRELDALIFAAVNGYEKRHNERLGFDQYWKDERWVGLGSMPTYTASIDAALTLAPEGCLNPTELIREAVSRLGKHFGLHAMHWPLLTPFTEYFARYVAAAALRARRL